ncbi:MAG: thioredoxin domain-containing protein, partial [Solirubrobacteraceae bacterium]
MTNALAHESSPYLRQHARNPVDWRTWGPAALAEAAARDVPLIVSIGYSACHWCHVMERESFEDRRVARLMNERFVCVKVDREERPDLDAIYIDAVQAMGGQGGWPLNVFITPEQVPFYGGTYFPPAPARGMPSWTQVLEAIASEWELRSEEISSGAERIRKHLAGGALLSGASSPIDPRSLEHAVTRLAGSFDELHGGFGGAPKFPQAPVLEFLLGEGALGSERAAAMAVATLEAMLAGGIHDQLGGGFHRYAVDATWTVPHFEKMLCDNALLARALARAHRLTGDARLLRGSVSTLTWALREMRGPEGGFYAALDADSGGVEGAFYVWTEAELRDALGLDAEAAIAWFGVTAGGNFVDPHDPAGGLNVLFDAGDSRRPDEASRARIRERLLERRASRVRPGLDSKRLAAWNALMVSALAEVASTLATVPPDALAEGEQPGGREGEPGTPERSTPRGRA